METFFRVLGKAMQLSLPPSGEFSILLRCSSGSSMAPSAQMEEEAEGWVF
jgi:hypothetical protein